MTKKKDSFDKFDAFDLVSLDGFDNVELPVEEKVVFSEEMAKLVREQLREEIGKLPIGKLVSEISQKEFSKQKESISTIKEVIAKEIENTKSELKNKIENLSKESTEFKKKTQDKYNDFLNKYSSIGQDKLYFGGPAAMRIQEEDGSNLGYPNSLKFSDGSVTVNSDGSYSISTSASSFSIPEVTSDPASPTAGDTWVLRTGQEAGTPIGLLLALTYSGINYFLSYQTEANTTIRVELT